MSSLISGFVYDIFISYRQKDNKGDKWVSGFAEDLQTELESAFKEDLSVYFDVNPHDGLLETHDVDASLKDKLRCIIFIPIISRTYCDPKSFAWQHEFKAFIESASQDSIGLKIRLPGGNIGTRILPVRIHDIDDEDRQLLEQEIHGPLRALDFIYREPGVNRPLTLSDDEKKNLNGTRYKNQMNKVANAIREIIIGIRNNTTSPDLPDPNENPDAGVILSKKFKRNLTTKKRLVLMATAIVAILLILGGIKIWNSHNNSLDASLEKSIVVLPFVNDSPDKENGYFINGLMDEILKNLQLNREFRVLSRTSSEKYREPGKFTIPEIAGELGVNYVVEGSGQKYGNRFVLRVQLIAANNERPLWSETYERVMLQTSDVIGVQSEVAQAIADALQSSFSHSEKEIIEKTPTKNLTALDFYQRGMEELNKKKYNRAGNLFRQALMYDSSYAKAYAGMALVYFNQHYYDSYNSDNYLDTLLILANQAQSLDRNLPEAYFVRGIYQCELGNTSDAENNFNIALKLNPSFWEVYNYRAQQIYKWINGYIDYYKVIECLQKVASLNHGNELPNCLRQIGIIYGTYLNLPVKAKYYLEEAFKLDADTSHFWLELSHLEYDAGNYEKAEYWLLKSYDAHPTEKTLIYLAECNIHQKKYTESLKLYKKYLQSLQNSRSDYSWGEFNRIGYVYYVLGYKEEASKLFSKQIEFSLSSSRLKRSYAQYYTSYYDLAGVFAFTGNKKAAYENLHKMEEVAVFPYWWIKLVQNDPLFNSIKNESEFVAIVEQMKNKYLKERERVLKKLQIENS